jgi:YD repeat-containing protein
VDSNLERVTDAKGHDTLFEYDLPGRLTRIYLPTNPTTPFVINTYDQQGRVTNQTDANGHDWQYYISGYRTEEVNPVGEGTVGYYNANGKTTRSIDPTGNETRLEYDGQQRVIKRTLPEGNYFEYGYDDHHNPVTITEHPKPGSTESPLVTQFTYDPVFSKVLTQTDSKGITPVFYPFSCPFSCRTSPVFLSDQAMGL